jgi:hypothetical protein
MDGLPGVSTSLTDFQLEDELLAEEGRDVMVGIRYTRRQRGGGTDPCHRRRLKITD